MIVELATAHDVVVLVAEIEKRHGNASGADGHRLRRIWAAHEDGTLVVARCPQTAALAGYGAAVRQLDAEGVAAHDPVFVIAGEVFPEHRSRGAGRLIVERCIQTPKVHRRTFARFVIDHDRSSPGLAAILNDLGFTSHAYVEVTRPAPEHGPPDLPPSVTVRSMRDDDVPWIEERQRHLAGAAPAGHGEYSVAQAWARAERVPLACLVATVGTDLAGYLLCLRFDDDPEDLWIEAMLVSDGLLTATDADVLLRLAVHAAPHEVRTVSRGVASSAAPEPWQVTRRWWRSELISVNSRD